MKSWQTSNCTTITRLLKGRSNVYLIEKNDCKILVDTGGSNRKRSLIGALAERNLARLDYLILTHTHFDHAGNAGMIRRRYDARVVTHTAEYAILAAGISIIPKGANIFTKAGVALGGKRFAALSRFAPCETDIIVEDKYAMPGLPGVTILHTPGHSAGSQCVIVDDEFALVGDTMFGMFVRGVYPPFADDPDLLIASWAKLLQTSCHTFLPGHGRSCKRNLVQKHFNLRNKVSPRFRCG